MKSKSPRLQRLGDLLGRLEKEIGRRAVGLLGESPEALEPPPPVPTGFKALDDALGGGLPQARIVELLGEPSAGKTALALALCASTQQAGRTAAFIDVDHAFCAKRAAAIGVDTSALIVAQPETGEQAMEITEALLTSGSVDFLVVDSIAALVPEGELDGRVGEAPPGLQARLVGQALRRLTVALRRHPASIVLTNQLRVSGFDGRTSAAPGGAALPFFSAVRAEVSRLGPIIEDGRSAGDRLAVRVVKSKLGPTRSAVEVAVRTTHAPVVVAEPRAVRPVATELRDGEGLAA